MLEKGVEPLLLAEYAPEAHVSASSTTRAWFSCARKEFTTYIKMAVLQTHVDSLPSVLYSLQNPYLSLNIFFSFGL